VADLEKRCEHGKIATLCTTCWPLDPHGEPRALRARAAALEAERDALASRASAMAGALRRARPYVDKSGIYDRGVIVSAIDAALSESASPAEARIAAARACVERLRRHRCEGPRNLGAGQMLVGCDACEALREHDEEILRQDALAAKERERQRD